jgi:hypothetical protein
VFGTPITVVVVVVSSRYLASMMEKHGVKKEGVVGSEDAEGRLPTVSGDKIDKENISPCLDLSL